MKVTEKDFGIEIRAPGYLAVFGNSKSSLDVFSQSYPHIQFAEIDQVHSDMLVAAPTKETADAHWTLEKNLGLTIKTADCMPILIVENEARPKVLAIHAGWRGVVNQITLKSLKTLSIKSGLVFIGPSIQQKSFEVDPPVFSLLEESAINLNPKDFSYEKNGKHHVDLNQIVTSQINTCGHFEFRYFKEDTLTSNKFNSYRRNGKNAGRNLSFIAKVDGF